MSCCPLDILSFFPLLSRSLALSTLAGPCVLHLSAGLGRRLDREDAGRYWDVKVTRAGCHPSQRFPLSSSIIEPLNQTPLHTGETFPSACVCVRRFGQGYSSLSVIYSYTAQRTWALYRTQSVCVILVIISDVVLYIGLSGPWVHSREWLWWNGGHNPRVCSKSNAWRCRKHYGYFYQHRLVWHLQSTAINSRGVCLFLEGF